jgi:hypothetical protein
MQWPLTCKVMLMLVFWRWRQYVSPKRWCIPTSITAQKTNTDIFTAVRSQISDKIMLVALTYACCLWRSLAVMFHLFVYVVLAECDRTIVSRPGVPQNGTFTAPTFINSAGHSRQCIYTFVAGQRQRVELVFTSFNLRGTPPEWVIRSLWQYTSSIRCKSYFAQTYYA